MEKILHTWLAGKHSCTLIISLELAKKFGLDRSYRVAIEERAEGILIRKDGDE
ncbi:MAG: hypothetical protein WAK17_25915 [Candidatus Nitrosopolaris sp.]